MSRARRPEEIERTRPHQVVGRNREKKTLVILQTRVFLRETKEYLVSRDLPASVSDLIVEQVLDVLLLFRSQPDKEHLVSNMVVAGIIGNDHRLQHHVTDSQMVALQRAVEDFISIVKREARRYLDAQDAGEEIVLTSLFDDWPFVYHSHPGGNIVLEKIY